MPVQPDPTHPKFLEGDDPLKPPSGTDDVQGHLAAAVPDETSLRVSPPRFRRRPTTSRATCTRSPDEPEGLAAAVPEETDDVEGHKTRSASDAGPEGLFAAVPEETEDVEGHKTR